MSIKTILVTGGAGFIGGCFVRQKLESGGVRVVNLDALTYAGNLDSIPMSHPNHLFVHGDIADQSLVESLLTKHNPEAIVNFAAESHVDRSIDGPGAFVQTNVVGTFHLLEASLSFFKRLDSAKQSQFRFLHVSTDEVYGSLGATGKFTETTPYAPNSPYSASKASSDMFVRSYRETFGLPTLITNCSNNYGPFQFPEKLVPVVILNALEGRPLPVYGDGLNIRDWLFVSDHCTAISTVLENGKVGETYNVGGDSERTNLVVVHTICDLVDELTGKSAGESRNLIRFVTDRPGHDRRYAIDASKIKSELGWSPSQTFEQGMRETVEWYLSNSAWIEAIKSGSYRRERLGLGVKQD
jgi:dTDP-glucose 4,6-dehydratase